jgi:predicted enzyme related to lactoylglutathione lyase
MAIKTGYEHGQFSWVDLMSHDMASAKQFYGKVFGWKSLDQDAQGGPPYAMLALEGKAAGGMGQMSDEMKAQGIPPMWNSYITVDDLEATVKKAQELGAQITVPVMPVVDAGSLAFFMDPTGAQVGLWQPNKHCGAAVVNEPGAFCWNELATRDIEKARDFYGKLLGWEFRVHEGTPSKYYIIKNKGNDNGGLMQMTEEWGEIPPCWIVYFQVSDIDASVKAVQEANGSINVPPFDTPVGKISVVCDPQGACFSLIQPAGHDC